VTPIDEKDCEGCPVLFERVVELDKSINSYGELLKKGNRYIYNIFASRKAVWFCSITGFIFSDLDCHRYCISIYGPSSEKAVHKEIRVRLIKSPKNEVLIVSLICDKINP